MLVERGTTGDPAFGAAITRALASPIDRIVISSILLGLAVGAGIVALAWLMRPDPGTRIAPSVVFRVGGLLASMSPMVHGVGILAVIGLAHGVSRAGGIVSTAAAPDASSLLIVAVGLSVATRLLPGWSRQAEDQPFEARSGLDAALIVGSSARGGRKIAAFHPGRWAASLILAVALAATNLVPALFFTPWMDERTAAPAMIVLAAGPQESRLQAAALACFVIAMHIVGLCAARLAPSPPPEWDADGR